MQCESVDKDGTRCVSTAHVKLPEGVRCRICQNKSTHVQCQGFESKCRAAAPAWVKANSKFRLCEDCYRARHVAERARVRAQRERIPKPPKAPAAAPVAKASEPQAAEAPAAEDRKVELPAQAACEPDRKYAERLTDLAHGALCARYAGPSDGLREALGYSRSAPVYNSFMARAAADPEGKAELGPGEPERDERLAAFRAAGSRIESNVEAPDGTVHVTERVPMVDRSYPWRSLQELVAMYAVMYDDISHYVVEQQPNGGLRRFRLVIVGGPEPSDATKRATWMSVRDADAVAPPHPPIIGTHLGAEFRDNGVVEVRFWRAPVMRQIAARP